MMKDVTTLLLLVMLAACASPTPEMLGAEQFDTVQGGIHFTVFQKGEMAEVIRHGYLTRVERAPVQGLMAEAVKQTTGCGVRPDSMLTRIPGDTGEARFRLTCGAI